MLILLAGDIATNPGPPPASNGYNIQCLYLNARSLITKTNELQTLAIDIDLLAITETWLKRTPRTWIAKFFLATILTSIGETRLTELVAVFY
jgi:hypothetical protein